MNEYSIPVKGVVILGRMAALVMIWVAFIISFFSRYTQLHGCSDFYRYSSPWFCMHVCALRPYWPKWLCDFLCPVSFDGWCSSMGDIRNITIDSGSM